MKRTLHVLGLLLVLLCAACDDDEDFLLGPPGVIVVDGAGGGDFSLIQDAIDHATPGSSIEVRGGSYSGPVLITMPLTLFGTAGADVEVRLDTELLGDPPVLEIRGVADVTVENMRFTGRGDGISIRSASEIRLAQVDSVANRDDGLEIQSSREVSVGGSYTDNGSTGIYAHDASALTLSATTLRNADSGVLVERCDSVSVRDGQSSENLADGVEVRQATLIEIRGNVIEGNAQYGVRTSQVSGVELQDNSFSGNQEGDLKQE